MEILQYQFMQHAVLAGILAGVGCSLIGVLIVSLKIPFLGVTMSHAGFAGAVLGIMLGVNPLICAFIFCCLASLFIGPITDRADLEPEVAVGIIFSVMLGLAFLFLAFLPGAKTEALSLMWGSILAVSRFDVWVIAVSALVVISFLILFFRQIKTILFNRQVAVSLGIPERSIYYAIIFLSGVVISANLTTIGGLLIFSLVVNPAAAAFQIAYNFKNMCILASIFGVSSCLFGLWFSYVFNVPAGAVIIISSSIIFSACLALSPKKKLRHTCCRNE
jgi:manganese/iron transport system permease protein